MASKRGPRLGSNRAMAEKLFKHAQGSDAQEREAVDGGKLLRNFLDNTADGSKKEMARKSLEALIGNAHVANDQIQQRLGITREELREVLDGIKAVEELPSGFFCIVPKREASNDN